MATSGKKYDISRKGSMRKQGIGIPQKAHREVEIPIEVPKEDPNQLFIVPKVHRGVRIDLNNNPGKLREVKEGPKK